MRMTRIRPEVLAAVTQVPEVRRATRRVAAQIRNEARALAPRRTGALRKSITVKSAYDKRSRTASYRVVVGEFYGRFVELGTEHQPPRPFLRPAADKFGAVAPRND